MTSCNRDRRDLKPENFLLASPAEDSPLKASDFGLSVFFRPNEKFEECIGSAYYIAPEVWTIATISAHFYLSLLHYYNSWSAPQSTGLVHIVWQS